MRYRLRRLALIPMALAGLTASLSAQAPPPPDRSASLEWDAIDRAVVGQLMTENLGNLVAKELESDATRDVGGLLRRLDVFARAGHRAGALETIDRLVVARPSAPTQQLSHLADFLIGREEWELARLLLERFPGAEPGWGYVFIKHWASNGDPKEIDRWLAAQSDGTHEYWFGERLRFRNAQGTAQELIDVLAQDVRAHREEIALARRYLRAAQEVGKRIDVDWIGAVVRPRLAYECYEVGHDLLDRGLSPRAAAALFERSLALPYTGRDRTLIEETMCCRAAAGMPDARNWERDFRLRTKVALAESYQASGRADEAQPLIEEVTAAAKDGLPQPGLGQFAGRVQRESGARIIEERIERAEAANTDSSSYWLTRAEYYAGRRERGQAIEAYEKALAIERSKKEFSIDRHNVVSDYARFLRVVADPRESSEATELLWREFADARPESDYAAWLVRDLLDPTTDDRSFLAVFADPVAAEDRFWTYLGARSTWGGTEGKLLRRVAEHLGPTERERRLARAEEMARNADPTRAQTLADLLLRFNEGARAIPLIRSVVERLPAGYDQNLAALSLLSAYLYHTNDWKAAETIFPAASRLFTPGELSERLGLMALMAARAGAHDDALRLWSMKANVDRADLRHLAEMAAAGMAERLLMFYQQLRRSDPASWVPEAALRLLQ